MMKLNYSTLKKLKRPIADIYLAMSAAYVRSALCRDAGTRSFQTIKIVAPFGRQNGISSGAVLQARALQRAGQSVELLDVTPALRNPVFRLDHIPGSAYVFHSGGPQTASLILGVLPQAATAYRIGYWAWELPTPPKKWPQPRDLVSEIWTPSSFSKASLSAVCNVPVHIVPHYVATETAHLRRNGGPFTVLAMADSRSSFDRKNPAGAVAAFRAAFGNDPAYKLILKLNGRTSVLDDLNIDTRRIIASQSNIEITTEFLDSEELDALYRSADVFLSLHRAEGFGLPILEAMARRIPVVVTAWSGNMDYTNDTNSVLIPCKIVPVQDSLWYSRYSNSEWAEPDIDAAALALRRLALERDYYEEIAEAGWNTVIRRNNDTVLPS